MQLKATDPETRRKLTVEIDIPLTLEGLIAKYGEAIVYHAATEKIRTKALNVIRHAMKMGHSDETILKAMIDWTPLKVMKRTRAAKLELSDEDILDAISEIAEDDTDDTL